MWKDRNPQSHDAVEGNRRFLERLREDEIALLDLFEEVAGPHLAEYFAERHPAHDVRSSTYHRQRTPLHH